MLTQSNSVALRSTLKSGLPLLFFGLVLLAANSATAQFSANALIGDSVSNPDDDRYSDVSEAIKRFANGDQLSARTFLERAVEKSPKLPPVGVLMVKLQLLSGRTQNLSQALEQAVQDDSANDPEPYLLLAEQALAGGRIIEADALFDKAVKKIEEYSSNARRKRLFQIRAYRGRSIVSDRRKDWDQAESDLRNWIELDPDAASAYSRLGQTLFMQGSETEGYKAFVKAKQLDDSIQSPYISAARMYDRLGETGKAMSAFAEGFKQSSTDENTLVFYAQALLKARDSSKAETVLRKARQEAPTSTNVWLLSAVASRMAGDAATAEQQLLRALALAPSNRDVLNQLAQVLVNSEDATSKQRALSFATMNAQINGKNPDVNITLAWVLYQNGRAREATQVIRERVQATSLLSPDGSLLLAKMLLAVNKTDDAKRILQSALENDQGKGIFVSKDEAQTLLSGL